MNLTSRLKKFLPGRSIFNDLIISLSLAVFFVSLGINVFNFWTTSKEFEQQFDDQARLYISTLQNALGPLLWNVDDDNINNFCSSYFKDNLVNKLIIKYADKIVIFEESKTTQKILEVSDTITYRGIIVGYIELGLTESIYQKRNFQLFRLNLIGMVIVLLILFVAARYLLKIFLKDPFDKLTQRMEQVAAGNYHQKFQYYAQEEIRSIVTRFDEMASKIENRENSLKKINLQLEANEKNLELKVDERTSELKQFREILEGTSDFVGMFDLDGKTILINNAGRSMLGFEDKEDVSETLISEFHPKEDFERIVSRGIPSATESGVWSGETCFINRKGLAIPTWQLLIAHKNHKGELKKISTIARDIRERKKDELELQQAKDQAESANKAKSEFLANMSHEIRTPMNAVLGFSEVLEELETDPKKSHYLDNIRTSGKALLNLINQVLDFSKIEAGKMELEYSAVSVEALFREMNTIFGHKIAGKGLVFEFKCESTVPNALILDETRIRQVLINLIGNAVKFTETGKICLRATAVESDSQSKGRVELTIEVEDTGVGVPDSQKDKIFGAFEQVEGQKTAVYGGTGLGLAITHKLVTMMQGKIGVYGEEGQGAIFKVKLPNVEIAALESLDADAKNALDIKTVSFEPATILITDDVDYNREIMTVYLAPFNFSFLYAVNGLEAIEQARKHHPDIILMDIKMPKLNGYEASKQLKADEALKTIPIIAVTASALEQDEAMISKLCDGYLRKPVSRVDMVRELMRYLPHEAGMAETAGDEKTAEGPMVIPPGAEMEKLHHLAMVGDMGEISQFAQTLIVKDESLRPFVRELQQLADKFMDSDILAMLEESMKDAG